MEKYFSDFKNVVLGGGEAVRTRERKRQLGKKMGEKGEKGTSIYYSLPCAQHLMNVFSFNIEKPL